LFNAKSRISCTGRPGCCQYNDPRGDSDDNEDKDEGKDEDDDDGPSDGGKKRKHSDVEEGAPGADAPGAACPDDAPLISLAPKRSDEHVRMMRTYLSASLSNGDFISVDTEPRDSPKMKLVVFQLVQKERTHSQVRLSRKMADEAPPLFKISIQRYEVFHGAVQYDVMPTSLDIFATQDPCSQDVLALCGTYPSDRSNIRIWSVRESDIDNCVCLYDPKELRCKEPLFSKRCPPLCLIDALLNAGFVGVHEALVHIPGDAHLRFDLRDSRAPYFRCVLARHYLFKSGCVSFKSGATNVYYECLLHAPSRTIPGQKAKAYRLQLKGNDVDYGAPLEAALSGIDAKPKIVHKVRELLPPSPFAESIGGASSDVRKSTAESSKQSSTSDSDSSSTSSSEAERSDGSVGGPETLEDGDGFPKKLFGETLMRKMSRAARGHEPRPGLEVACPNVLHRRGIGCTRFRSIHLDVGVHGPRSAEFYLGCWMLEAYNKSQDEHRRYRPKVAEVRVHRETYEGEG